MSRVRALELLRNTLKNVQGRLESQGNNRVNKIMRRNVIENMLFVIREYPFSSIAS